MGFKVLRLGFRLQVGLSEVGVRGCVMDGVNGDSLNPKPSG